MFTAVFDLDGTLADTAGDLLAAANAVFAECGYERPLTMEDRQTALHGGRAMLRLGAERLGAAEIEPFADANYDPLLAHYRENLAVHTTLYPDAHDVVTRLKARGWQVAVCTNKPIEMATPLLSALKLSPHLDAVVGARSYPVSKPDPLPLLETIRIAGGAVEKSVLIGDSATDYNTAKNAGTAILLVDFDDTNISADFPDAPVVHDFAALETWLETWRNSRQ